MQRSARQKQQLSRAQHQCGTVVLHELNFIRVEPRALGQLFRERLSPLVHKFGYRVARVVQRSQSAGSVTQQPRLFARQLLYHNVRGVRVVRQSSASRRADVVVHSPLLTLDDRLVERVDDAPQLLAHHAVEQAERFAQVLEEESEGTRVAAVGEPVDEPSGVAVRLRHLLQLREITLESIFCCRSQKPLLAEGVCPGLGLRDLVQGLDQLAECQPWGRQKRRLGLPSRRRRATVWAANVVPRRGGCVHQLHQPFGGRDEHFAAPRHWCHVGLRDGSQLYKSCEEPGSSHRRQQPWAGKSLGPACDDGDRRAMAVLKMELKSQLSKLNPARSPEKNAPWQKREGVVSPSHKLGKLRIPRFC